MNETGKYDKNNSLIPDTAKNDRLPGGFFISRQDGTLIYASKNLIDVFECDSYEDFAHLIKGDVMNMIYSRDRNRTEGDLWAQIHSGGRNYAHISYRIATKRGKIRYIEQFATVVNDEKEGNLLYAFTADSDIKYLTYELNKLTGLPGMNRFIEFAGNLLDINQKNASAPQFAFIFFNVRRFKMINVKFGLEAGNEFLKRVAEILRTAFRDDLIAHLADDHFAVLTDTNELYERIRSVHDMLEAENRYVSVELKAGVYKVVGYPCDVGVAVDLAKLACDSIRESVSEYVREYTSTLSSEYEISRFAARNLDSAIENGDIRVFYQPVIRTISGKVCSMEALARWYNPESGMLPPGLFISALEENRQIYKLDCFMIEQICRDYRAIADRGGKAVPVSFNLSRFDFLLCDIFDVVENAVNKYHVPRDMLHIEITESMVVSDGGRVKETIDRLHKAGYLIWMDDFGSGYSSLGVLKDYEFDELKIDMTFLRNMNTKARNIITAVVRMAKSIGIHTLAEGVETAEQFDFLLNIGCENVQGFLFGRPAPYEECLVNLDNNGIVLETAAESAYYDPAGELDFLTDKPMALLEKTGGELRFIYANSHFQQELRSMGINGIEDADEFIAAKWLNSFVDRVECSSKPETLRFSEKGSRIKLTAEVISRLGARRLIRAELINITRDKRSEYVTHMDERLKAIYREYLAVYLVKCRDGIAELVYIPDDMAAVRQVPVMNFAEMTAEYAANKVPAEDRERFLLFHDLNTLPGRISNSEHGCVSAVFDMVQAEGETAGKKLIYSFTAVPGSAGTELLLTLRPMAEIDT